MNISFIKPFHTFSNPIGKSSANPVCFKSNNSFTGKDTFELQDECAKEISKIQKIIQENEAKMENPNTTKQQKLKLFESNMYYKEYIEQYKKDSVFSFLNNPELNYEEKIKIGKEKGIIRVQDLSDKLNINPNIVLNWCKAGTFDETYYVNQKKGYFINTNTKATSDFIDNFQKNREFYISPEDLCLKYNIPVYYAPLCLRDKRLKFLGIDKEKYYVRLLKDNVLIDTKDEESAKFLESIKKIHPQKSKYYYSKEISASYLEKLGFGDVEIIKEMIRKNLIDGSITSEEVNNSEPIIKTIIRRTDKTQNALIALRNNLGRIKEINNLSKKLGISKDEMKQILLDDKMEIIPVFLFANDRNKVLIDTENPKNKEFIQHFMEHKC